MKRFFSLILSLILTFGCGQRHHTALRCDGKPSFVFIHIGESLPSYLPIAVEQARLFNPKVPIYLVANAKALQDLPPSLIAAKTICVPCETLAKSALHKQFITQSSANRTFRKGFWIVTTERFYYLAELMRIYGLSRVFHLENDVMIYTDIQTILPTFKAHYSHQIGATFDNDQRCIAGLIYIDQIAPLQHFLSMVANMASQGGNDMEFLGKFKKQYQKQWIDSLPIIMPEYAKDFAMISREGDRTDSPESFSRHIEEFGSLFDAAALGQYLGGIDPFHAVESIGFINERCLFDPSRLQFVWEEDERGRTIPVAVYKEQKWKINNLHIHSKNLALFRSKVVRNTSAPFLSGDTFRAAADHVYDEIDSSLQPKAVQQGHLVFVKTDYLDRFVHDIHPHILHPYILITHNSDDPSPGPYRELLDGEKLLAWFGQNHDGYAHPKMYPLPIGLANRCWNHGDPQAVQHVKIQALPKRHLAYMNLNVETYPQERRGVYDYFLHEPYCYIPDSVRFKGQPEKYETFLQDVASSIFVIAPRGNGLDTHRLWEALYLGSIPVVKSSSLDPLYRDLPVLIVKDWTEVTEEFLQKQVQEFQTVPENLESLYIDYWIQNIRNKIHNILD